MARQLKAAFGTTLRGMRQRRGWTQSQLADRASVSVQAVSAYESGLRFPSRDVVERLVADMEDRTLVLRDWERSDEWQRWISDRPVSQIAVALAVRLQQGLGAEEEGVAEELGPLPGGSVPSRPGIHRPAPSGPAALALEPAAVMAQSLDLLQMAAGRPGDGRSVVIAARHLEVPALGSPGEPARRWSSLLGAALEGGWRVVHLLGQGEPGAPLAPHLQAELAGNVLAHMSARGEYRPVAAQREGYRDLLVDGDLLFVEGVGVQVVVGIEDGLGDLQPSVGVVLRADPGEEGHDAYVRVSERLLGDAERRSSRQLLLLSEGETQDRLLRFDWELAEAEDLLTERRMVKRELSVATIPPEIALASLTSLRGAWGQLFAEQWVRRHETFLAKIASGARYREICTREGIRAYLSGGSDGRGLPGSDALVGTSRLLPWSERLAHVEYVADLLGEAGGYELAVAPSDCLLVDVARTWWAVARGPTQGADGVFFMSHRRGSRRSVRGILRDTDQVQAVASFVELFDLLWEWVPPEYRDREKVRRWLRSAVGEARAAGPPGG